jgi:hypothetical protein
MSNWPGSVACAGKRHRFAVDGEARVYLTPQDARGVTRCCVPPFRSAPYRKAQARAAARSLQASRKRPAGALLGRAVESATAIAARCFPTPPRRDHHPIGDHHDASCAGGGPRRWGECAALARCGQKARSGPGPRDEASMRPLVHRFQWRSIRVEVLTGFRCRNLAVCAAGAAAHGVRARRMGSQKQGKWLRLCFEGVRCSLAAFQTCSTKTAMRGFSLRFASLPGAPHHRGFAEVELHPPPGGAAEKTG